MTAMLELATDDPRALVDLYAAHGWGDGLPLVAPTSERVEAMLAYATGDHDEPLGLLHPRGGVLTRRIVAVNSVLAGCPDEVFPVVLTAARALAQPEVNLRGVNATTHPVSPLTIVHGEVVNSAGFNSGAGAFGPGNRANATVGRAIRLLLLHVAGAVPGSGDASSQGQPAKYAYCAAENLAASPWPGYAERRGVSAPSAVTVHCGEGPHNVHDMEAAGDAVLILDKLTSAMTSLGMNNACIAQGEIFLALGPEHAMSLQAGGFGPDQIAEYLWEQARHPASQLRRHFEELAWPEWMKAADDDTLLPMTETPDNIRCVVIGGAGKHSSVIPSWGMTRSVTLPVEG